MQGAASKDRPPATLSRLVLHTDLQEDILSPSILSPCIYQKTAFFFFFVPPLLDRSVMETVKGFGRLPRTPVTVGFGVFVCVCVSPFFSPCFTLFTDEEKCLSSSASLNLKHMILA